MSVVTTLTAVPNRMSVVWEFLAQAGDGTDEDELARLLRPPSLQRRHGDNEDEGTGAMVTEVLGEMRALQLIKRNEQGKVSLSPDLKSHHVLPIEHLERSLLDTELARGCGQSRVPGAFAWFLIQDPSHPLPWNRNPQADIEAQCGSDVDAFDLTATARFQQFVYWARYLGFGWRIECDAGNVIFPDPTVAFARNLPAFFGKNSHRPIGDVLNELGKVLPVIEGGIIRSEIESRFHPNRRRVEGHLSRSTSLALERLESLGCLRLEQLADAPGLTLDRTSGPRPVSHIKWLGGG